MQTEKWEMLTIWIYPHKYALRPTGLGVVLRACVEYKHVLKKHAWEITATVQFDITHKATWKQYFSFFWKFLPKELAQTCFRLFSPWFLSNVGSGHPVRIKAKMHPLLGKSIVSGEKYYLKKKKKSFNFYGYLVCCDMGKGKKKKSCQITKGLSIIKIFYDLINLGVIHICFC